MSDITTRRQKRFDRGGRHLLPDDDGGLSEVEEGWFQSWKKCQTHLYIFSHPGSSLLHLIFAISFTQAGIPHICHQYICGEKISKFQISVHDRCGESPLETSEVSPR